MQNMDDPVLFANFLQNVAGLTVARSRNEVLGFVDTFRSLLSTSEDELDSFVKNTHSSNTARNNNQRILIPTRTVIALKALIFELKDRERCDALPAQVMLQNLNAAEIALLRARRNDALQESSQSVSLPAMTVPKLTATNYDTFITSFRSLASRTPSSDGSTLDYLMREQTGNYDAAWPSRSERLKNCMRLRGPHFVKDRQSLYSLFIEHVGTEGYGSDIVNKFQASKNGYACYLAFNAHFKNDAYLENMAASANKAIQNAVYKGDRQHFTLETYYTIMSRSFNELAKAGNAHALNKHQKITKFESGLKDTTAISWAITAKNQWNSFPPAQQTFDGFYNKFSKYMTKFKTLSKESTQTSQIASLNTAGRGRGRGRGRGGRNGRGRGRGRRGGRGGSYNPYSLNPPSSGNASFTPQAKIYTPEEWSTLSVVQRRSIQELKAEQGWINGQTPPHGFVIGQDGFAAPSTHLVAAVQQSIQNSNESNTLPPPPSRIVPQPSSPVPPIINTNASSAGASFGCPASRTPPPSSTDGGSVSQVSMVSINGQPYGGPVYDANGHRIA